MTEEEPNVSAYNEWEAEQNISRSSLEAHYAQAAWSKALELAAKDFKRRGLMGDRLLSSWADDTFLEIGKIK